MPDHCVDMRLGALVTIPKPIFDHRSGRGPKPTRPATLRVPAEGKGKGTSAGEGKGDRSWRPPASRPRS